MNVWGVIMNYKFDSIWNMSGQWGARHAVAAQVILLATLGLSVAEGKDGKVSKDLARLYKSSTMVDVIVRFKGQLTEAKHQKAKNHGSTLKKELRLINSAAYTMRASDAAGLALEPEVDYISLDRQVTGRLDHAAPSLGIDLAYNNGWDGKAVGVALLDSGVTQVKDLLKSGLNGSNQTRLVYSESF